MRGYLHSLGGTYHANLINDTTHLIVKRVGSQKYIAAKKLGIPILVMQWLKDCYDATSKVHTTPYLAGPFHGLTVCCTQMSPEERYVLEKTVLEHGGTFMKELDADAITHLVASAAEGPKYAAAKLWGLTTVSPHWVTDCVAQKRWLAEQPYMTIEGNMKQKPNSSASNKAAAEEKARSMAAAIEKYNTLKQEEELSRAAKRAAEKMSAVLAGAAAEAKAQQEEEEASRFLWEDLPHPRDIPADRRCALENTGIFFAGFTKEQLDYLITMSACGGAMRQHVLSNSTTHILLGEQASDAIISEACGHAGRAPCVQVQWLVEMLVPGYMARIDQARVDELAAIAAEHERVAAEAVHNQRQQQQQQQQQHQQQSKGSASSSSSTRKHRALRDINENISNPRSAEDSNNLESSVDIFAREVLNIGSSTSHTHRPVRALSTGINRSVSVSATSQAVARTSSSNNSKQLTSKTSRVVAPRAHPLVVDWGIVGSEPQTFGQGLGLGQSSTSASGKKRARDGEQPVGDESQWVVWD